MVINIPINLDERIFEEKVQRDYDRILEKRLMETIERTLIESAGYSYRYSYIRNPENGMRKLIENHLDDFMKEHKDEIIAQAADILAKRVQRTKKAKEEVK